jgi:ribosomal protein S27E
MGRRIFPFRIADVRPSGSIAYTLVGIQWFDAFEPPMEAHIASLAGEIRSMAAASEPIPSPEPLQKLTGQPARDPGNRADIFFACRNCNQRLVIAAEAAGMAIDCPHCGAGVTVPSGGAEGRVRSAAAEGQTPVAESAPVSQKAGLGWDEATIAEVTRSLAVFIGPIASIMVQRALPGSKTGAELYDRLAGAIPDEKDRKKFLQSAPVSMR